MRNVREIYRSSDEVALEPLGAELVRPIEPQAREAFLLAELEALQPGLDRSVVLLSLAEEAALAGRMESARERYAACLAQQPACRPAIEGLARIMAEAGEWDQRLKLIEQAIEAIEEPNALLAYRLDRAETLARRLNRPKEALEVYAAVLEETPNHWIAFSKSREILLELKDYAKLVALYAKWLESESDPNLRLHWTLQALYLYRHHVRDLEAASVWVDYGLRLDETSLAVNLEAYELAEANREPEKAIAALKRLAALPSSDALKAAYRARAGQLSSVAGKIDEANHLYLQALQLQPDQPVWAEALAEGYAALESWPELFQLRERQTAAATGSWKKWGRLECSALLRDKIRTIKNPIEKALEYLNDIEADDVDRWIVYRRKKELLADLKDYEGIVDLIDEEIQRVSWPEWEYACRLESGTLAEESLRRLDRALADFERCREIQPDDLFAQSALERLYRLQGEWERFVELHRLQGEREEEAALAFKHEMEQAVVYQRQLGDYMAALERLGKALALQPSNLYILRQQEALAPSVENHDTLLSSLQTQRRLAKEAGQEALLLDLSFRIGEALADKTLQYDEAKHEFSAVLQENPEHWPSLFRLDDIYRKTENAAHRVSLWESMLDAMPDGPDKIAVQCGLAEDYAGSLDQPEKALAWWTRLNDENPNDGWSAQGTLRLASRMMREESMRRAYARLTAIADEKEYRVYWAYKSALLSKEILDDSEGGRNSLEAALALQADHWGALEALTDLNRSEGEVSATLDCLRKRIDLLPDPERRIDELLTWAEARSQSGADEADTLAALQKAYEADPENARVIDALLGSLRRAGEWARWIRLREVRRRSESDFWSRREGDRSSARLAGGELENAEESRKHLKRALAELAEKGALDWGVLFELRSSHQEREDWDGLLELADRLTRHAADPQHRIAAHLEIAYLWEAKFANLHKAADQYRTVLSDLDPDHVDSLIHLGRLLMRLEDWPALADHLRILIEKGEKIADPIETRLLLGQLLKERLDRPTEAIGCLVQARASAPNNEEILRNLQDLYRQTQQWPELIEACDAELALAGELDRRRALRFEMGDLWRSRMDNRAEAVSDMREILKEEEDQLQALALLTEDYVALGQWAEAESTLVAELKHQTDGKRRLDRWMRLHETRYRLNQPGGAIEALQEACGEFSDATEPLDALLTLLDAEDRFEELVDALDRRAELSRDDEQRARLLQQKGLILEDKLERPAEALEAFYEALKIEPRLAGALERSAQIHWSQGRAEDCSELYGRLKTVLGEEDFLKRPRACFELGDAFIRLEKWDEAQSHLEASLAANPMGGGVPTDGLFNSPEMIELANQCRMSLADLEFGRDRYEEASELLAQLLGQMQKDDAPNERLAPVLFRLGETFYKRKMWREALGAFQDCLQVEPSNGEAWKFAGLLLESLREYPNSLNAYAQALERLEDPENRIYVLNQMARIRLEHVSDPIKARECLNQALELEPENLSALSQLKLLLIQTGESDQLTDVCLRLVKVDPDARRKAQHYATLAGVAEDSGDPQEEEKAIGYYREAMQAHPGYTAALEGMERVFARHNRWDDLIEEYRNFISGFPQEKVKETVPAYEKIAKIYEEKLGNHVEAIRAYQLAAKLDPSNAGVHRSLAYLFGQTPEMRQEEIRELYALLDVSPFETEAYQRLGDLFMEQKRFDAAFCVCKALDLLGAASESQADFIQQHLAKQSLLPKKDLSSLDIDRFLRPDKAPGSQHMGMLERMTPLMMEAFGKTPQDLALPPNERSLQPAAAKHRTLFDKIAQTLGIESVEWYNSPSYKAHMEPVYPPVILTHPDYLEERSSEEIRFLLGRLLGRLLPGNSLVFAMEQPELQKGLALYRRTFDSNFKVVGASEEEIKSEIRRIRKLVSWKTRLTVRESLAEFPGFGSRLDHEAWRASLMESADRVGTLFCGDLATALRCAKSEIPEIAENDFSRAEDRVHILSKSPVLLNLFRFYVSEAHFNLRSRTGLALNVSEASSQ